MKLLQITPSNHNLLRDKFPRGMVVVESQPYGQDSDLLLHIVTSDDMAEQMLDSGIEMRLIEDKGRTPGFWQNLAGSGVYKAELAGLYGMRKDLITSLHKVQPAKVSITGKTWEEIISLLPEGNAVSELLRKVTKVTPKNSKAKKSRTKKIRKDDK